MKVFLLILTIVLFLGCNSNESSSLKKSNNQIDSFNINSSSERIKELSKYFILRTDIIDAEFDIYDVNLNVGRAMTIPGPTHRDFKVALKIKKSDTSIWLSDVKIENEEYSTEWINDIVYNSDFKLKSKPIFYTNKEEISGGNKILLHYEDENIMFIRVMQR